MTALAIASLGFGGCGDDSCGPQGAPDSGIVASTAPTAIEYGNLDSGLNNDCPAADQPEGIVSLTIAGTQTGGPGLFTLCIERPDRLNGTLDLGIDERGSPVHIVDVTGNADNCSYRFDETTPPSGTATGDGVCGNGGDPAGFAIVLDGMITLDRTCGATVDKVAVTLRGRVAVAP